MSQRYIQVIFVDSSLLKVASYAYSWLILGVLLLSVSLPVAAQIPGVAGPGQTVESASGSTASVKEQAEVQTTAPVVVDGRTLFELRGVSSYSAEERAAETAKQIIAAAENTDLSTSMLRVETGEESHEIYIGDQALLNVFEADARVESVQRSVLAEAKMEAIREAIDSYRKERSEEHLLQNSLYAILGTALFVGLIIGLRWSGRKLRTLFETRYMIRLEEMEEKSHKVLRAEQLWGLISFTQRAAAILIVLLASYVYINSVLSLFPWTRAIGSTLLKYLMTPIKALGTGLLDFLPNFFFLLILFFFVRFLLGATQGLFSAIAKGRINYKGFDAEWAWPTYRIVRIMVIAFALVVAYPYIPGSDSGAFKAISLFIGVVISIGSSSFISNFIAGYMLTYRRAFKLGSIIKVGDVTGEVIETRILSTHLRTWKNEEVVLPNSMIVNGQVTNYSSRAKREGLILHTSVGIGYEVPWRQVKAMLLMAAKRTKGAASNREPFVRQKLLGDFGITYQINVYCDTPERMQAVYSELHENIQDVFNEHGVAIMTPAYVADPAEPKFVPREKWFEAPAVPPGGK